MARSCYRLHAIFLLSCFCSMSSMDVRLVAASLSLDDLPVSVPSAIIVFPGAAPIGYYSPTKAELHLHGSPGRVSWCAKQVPLWGNHTDGMSNLTAIFSFVQIIPYPRSSSYFAWTAPQHVYGQNLLGVLPFPYSITNWNCDHYYFSCFNPESDARGSKLMGNDVSSSVYTETTSSSKNLSFLPFFLLYNVSNLPRYTGAPIDGFSFIDCSGPPMHGFSFSTISPMGLTPQGQETAVRVPRRQLYSMIPYERRTRRLLSGTHGPRATRTQQVAVRGKVKITSSWLKQVSVAASALVGLTCAVAGLVICCIRSKRPRQKPASIELQDDEHITTEPELRRGLGPREFTHSELAAATDNFAEERKIGRGGFGPVYRGCLSEEDRHVAIKVLSQELSVQGLKEFQAEVTTLSQLRHRNIVRLVGWCGRRGGLAVVYELMPGGSLDTHLYNTDRHLTWPQRYKIALQLGSALRYLHTDCDQCVVHGDIKPANIMLDASGNAKLGDFGLARLVDHGAEPRTTQVVAGTVGYIDPEFVSSRRPSAESDVYSFGVVLLEIACGRRPTPSRRPDQAASATLLASVRDMYRRNVILDAADQRLDAEFDRVQMERLLVTGLWCAHHDPVQRPSIAQAVDVLRSEDAELPVVQMMDGSDEEICALEGQAYGDLSAQSSVYLDASTETGYLTIED